MAAMPIDLQRSATCRADGGRDRLRDWRRCIALVWTGRHSLDASRARARPIDRERCAPPTTTVCYCGWTPVPVPGCPAAWETNRRADEIAGSNNCCSRQIRRLAIDSGRRSAPPVADELTWTVPTRRCRSGNCRAAWVSNSLIDGRGAAPAVFRQPGRPNTLDELARNGRGFYHGRAVQRRCIVSHADAASDDLPGEF